IASPASSLSVFHPGLGLQFSKFQLAALLAHITMVNWISVKHVRRGLSRKKKGNCYVTCAQGQKPVDHQEPLIIQLVLVSAFQASSPQMAIDLVNYVHVVCINLKLGARNAYLVEGD
ncbi:hypothetical protein AB205_0081750, partial [Aquarana catesbeiana]